MVGTAKYAGKEHIEKVFSHCLAGDWDGFFSWVVPDVRKYLWNNDNDNCHQTLPRLRQDGT